MQMRSTFDLAPACGSIYSSFRDMYTVPSAEDWPDYCLQVPTRFREECESRVGIYPEEENRLVIDAESDMMEKRCEKSYWQWYDKSDAKTKKAEDKKAEGYSEKDVTKMMEQFQFDADTREWENGRCESKRLPKSFSK